MVSCSEYDKLGSSVLDTNPPARTVLDNWILEHLTKPHNIEVIYRWHYTESDLSRYLTPATEKNVEGFVKILNAIWTEPYVKIAGLNFFNATCPKQVMLVGSSSYNSNSTVTLGTAEAGRKIVLYEVDEFDRKNAVRLKRYMKTIHHEYTHIQNQLRVFDPEFELITASGYRTDWNNVNAQTAYNAGFITPYAQAAPTEDFAEMVAIMLTNSSTQWNNILNNMPDNATAKDNLRKKEALVIKYYKEVWGFDILELQAELERAIDKVVNE
jgi:substrate import-associated zinc metallohydrolase lipoprotein